MNRTIFAVDDEQGILDSYKELLGLRKQKGLDFFSKLQMQKEDEAFHLETFLTGEAYLQRLHQLYENGEKLPILLLDMRLPKKHGFEVAKETRAIDKDIIIIIITAYADYSVKELAQELDENVYYLSKPYREDELYLLISSNLKQWNNAFNRVSVEKELAIDAIEDGLWNWDIKADTLYLSPRWKEMIGYKEDELENLLSDWSSRVHPDDLQKAMADVQAHLDKKSDYYINEHRLRCKDGSYIWVLARGKALFSEDGEPIKMTGFHTDITERKRLEEELLGLSQQLSSELEVSISKESKLKHTNLELEQKLLGEIEEIRSQNELLMIQSRHAQMGEMMSMIAHQWRQPLGVLSMSVNNLLVDVELELIEPDTLKEELQEMNNQLEHLSQTIDEFRNFFREDKKRESVSVSEVFESALGVIGKTLQSEKISLERDFEPLPKLNIFTRELEHVFINLLTNAKEAMAKTPSAKRSIWVKMYQELEDVMIEVCDSGSGIDEQILDKIFEPYFSTKDEKNGTGLGLYMSKMIIEKHFCGTLSVSSSCEGSCFKIAILKKEKS